MWRCWAGAPKGELAEQEIFTLPELVKAFDIDGHLQVPGHLRHGQAGVTSTAVYPRGMTPEAFRQGGRALHPPDGEEPRHLTPRAHRRRCCRPRCEVLTDIPEKVDFFDALPEYDIADSIPIRSPRPTPTSRSRCSRRSSPLLEDAAGVGRMRRISRRTGRSGRSGWK